MAYSQNQLKDLIQSNPKELIRFITSPNADTHLLALGAEFLGEISDERIVLPAFRQLLRHVNAVIREGALTGISSFYSTRTPPQDIIDRLQSIIKTDPSPDLKEYAQSLIKDFAQK